MFNELAKNNSIFRQLSLLKGYEEKMFLIISCYGRKSSIEISEIQLIAFNI